MTEPPGRLAVVGNRQAPEVTAVLERSGATVEHLTAADGAATRRSIAAAVERGVSRIVVIGGDGIVHDAVQVLAGTDVVLGIVAYGTGNDFARALGLPVDDPVAAATAALGDARRVDLIHCDHGWVASVATCGFSARVNERANRMRVPRGPSRYTMATLALLPRLRADRLELAVDGGTPSTIEATLVAVGNTAYFGGGMQICPDAQPDDGILDVAVVGRLGRLALLRFLPTVFGGRHRDHRSMSWHRCTEVTIRGDVELWGDGEPLGPTPVTLRAVPGALSVAGIR